MIEAPWTVEGTPLSEARILELRQKGWDRTDLAEVGSTQAFYNLVVAEGGRALTPADFPEGSHERTFLEYLPLDPLGPEMAGCPWQSFDNMGKAIAMALAEGIQMRRDQEPRP